MGYFSLTRDVHYMIL